MGEKGEIPSDDEEQDAHSKPVGYRLTLVIQSVFVELGILRHPYGDDGRIFPTQQLKWYVIGILSAYILLIGELAHHQSSTFSRFFTILWREASNYIGVILIGLLLGGLLIPTEMDEQ